ncbi:unnamed protein product [Rotaria magnacalcarata]|uniref:Uncharacterized protein n=1 Tax=Rotaria magnacalcarata TaxID=392030 RepID=A0A816FXZ8_9BILA|nr:unnamed protein product [Rotaria magnacalcarata]CAF1667607.1 unnamed protein product [Rotaria magnacalcarata]CAF1935396.1 unnamed protein product [Rotaria magnacalcarata]CAF3798605.1 unnamed protein product [Rotaria magnacalcarata]CAF3801744.1 unnamed protein product [Rotaria magnacalcarata]
MSSSSSTRWPLKSGKENNVPEDELPEVRIQRLEATPVEENDQGSNTTVCSIEYDNITPNLRGFTADIRRPCMAVILPLLKRLNTA